jgi:hypothetical protein
MKPDLFGYELRVRQSLCQQQLEHRIPKRVRDFGVEGLRVMLCLAEFHPSGTQIDAHG